MVPDINTQIIANRHLRCLFEGVELYSYDFIPSTIPTESPRPFMRSLRTLAGHEVTCYRPSDHRWHVGLSMTFAELSGQNFWGGKTYVNPERGYEQLNNNGTQKHMAWKSEPSATGLPRSVELLEWISSSGAQMLTERRVIEVVSVDQIDSFWTLGWTTELRNCTEGDLEFGSPTTRGRPNAGYGGLFWRGPRSLTDGEILTSRGTTDPNSVMGGQAEWLAYTGPLDEVDHSVTLVFVDMPNNPRYPTQWFLRKESGYAAVSFAFIFDTPYILGPYKTIEVEYKMVIGDGKWDSDKIRAIAAQVVG